MGSLASSPPSHPATDPAVYDAHHQGFNSSPVPSKPEEWLHRAARVSAILAEDAAHREKENKSPIAEVSLLKSSGLTKVIGPQKYGGGGQGWDVAYKVIREIAKADGSIGMLLGYHLLWSWTANVVGTDEQKDRTQKLIIVNNYFIGGAVNPRDNDQKITDDGDHIVFSGFKHFNTGGVVSDLTVLEGVCRSPGASNDGRIALMAKGLRRNRRTHLRSRGNKSASNRLLSQLGQHRPSFDRVWQRQDRQRKSALDRCPWLESHFQKAYREYFGYPMGHTASANVCVPMPSPRNKVAEPS